MNDEPTQMEIDGVAAVFAEVADDPTAQDSAYIMAKKLKRVFVGPRPDPLSEALNSGDGSYRP